MPGTDSIVGMYGGINEDIYLRKIEKTCMFEDDAQIENYQRNLLKNTRPDAPFFESDQPRRDFQSTSVINLRDGGRRDKTDPDLPDGIQLNFDPWIENSPAGVDYQLGVSQQKARAKLIKFYPDNDDSVPESMIHPYQMVRQIKAGQPWTQERLKIFETSKDGMQHGFNAQEIKCRPIEKVTPDNVIPHINECAYKTRIGNTSALSNETHLGYWTDTDHSFKIARYGQVRAGMPVVNYYTNREGTFVDHRIPILREGVNISPDLALLMANLALKKTQTHQIAGDTIIFPNIVEAGNRAQRITADDLMKIRVQAVQTAAIASNMLLHGEITPKDGRGLVQPIDVGRVGKIIVDPEIIEFMASMLTNKHMRPRDMDDLREKIEQTAMKSGVYVMDQQAILRKNGPQVYEALVSREAEKTGLKAEESKQIFNYAALPPQDANHMEMQKMEAYKSISKERAPGAGNPNVIFPHQTDVTTTGSNVFNQLAGATKDRFTGGIKNKYNFGMMDTEPQDSLPDRESFRTR
jgi:hypothetical protein